jgi:hypothetical protein
MAHPRRHSILWAKPQKRLCVDEQATAVDSDLFADKEISVEELEAIARLLGDDFKSFLSKA